jgi:cytochrome c biogenesis protein CcdA/thiol-disulfide isomerase/thioredoxin
MVVLMTFAFLAGTATVLSPCILPILPAVLASAVGSTRWRPLGMVLGLVVSFAFFTLTLTTIVSLFGVSADLLRLGGAVVIGLFGVVMIVPRLQHKFEELATYMPNVGWGGEGKGFVSGALVGASLGLVWAPCAGPILAAVTTVVATNRISPQAVFVTLAYAFGAGVPMLAIAYGGRRVISRVDAINKHTVALQRSFGVVMVAFALTFFVGLDRQVQAALVQGVPVEWTNALIGLEDRPEVRDALDDIRGRRPEAPSGAAQAAPAPQIVDSQPAESRDAGLLPASELPDMGPAPELEGIVGWVNGEPATIASLRGKVVIVDFWTYSCINCIRTLPYLNDWHAKYADDGLVILGVHTPEFEFEKSRDNVARATQQYGIQYLVAQDNNYATWEAYDNLYWPAKYIIDANGRVRYTHFGEGEYEKAEAVIRTLLAEAGMKAAADGGSIGGYALAPGRTPETYLGAARLGPLASPEPVRPGTQQEFSLPERLQRDQFALAGTWTLAPEHAQAGEGARLDIRFFADKVYLVLTPESGGDEVEVLLDGRRVGDGSAGADALDGVVEVNEPRLYTLVDLRGQPGEHTLTLRFLRGGTNAYAFTFG